MPAADASGKRPRRPYRPLVPAAFALAAGILADATLAPSVGATLLAGAALVAIGGACFFVPRLPRGARAIGIACTLALVACAGALNHAAQFRRERPDTLARALELAPDGFAIARVRGRVLEAPLPLERALEAERLRFVVEAESVVEGGDALPASGRFELTLYDVEPPAAGVGDRVEVLARFRVPRVARRPGAFDYGTYLARRRIGLVASAGSAKAIRVLEKSSAFAPRALLARTRARLVEAVERALPPRAALEKPSEEAALLAAVLLGHRASLDAEQKLAFTRVGVGHILSVSGLHVMLLVGALWIALSRLGMRPRPRALLLVAFTLAYVAVVGARAPAVRAGVIATVYMLGLALGRQADGRNSLGAAALLILAWNPAQLFAVGFGLSFAAVIFLACLVPLFEGAWRERFRLPDRLAETALERRRLAARRWLRHSLFASTAAALGSLPLVAHVFGVVSPYGVLTNLVAIPLASGVLATGLATCLVSLVLPPLAPAAGWLVRPLLVALDLVARAVAHVPGATAFVDRPAAWSVAAWYVLAFILFALAARAPWRTWWRTAGVGALLSLGAIFLTMRPTAPPEGELWIDALELPRGGRAALVRASGVRLLVDAGGRGRTLADALRWARSGRLDAALVLSERAEEAAGGAVELIRRRRTRLLLVPRGTGYESAALALAREAARADGVPLERIGQGRALDLGRARLEIVGARPPKERGGPAPPLSARLRWRNRAVLFVDASSARSIAWLLADRRRLEADLLVLAAPSRVPHALGELLDATGARAAVVYAPAWRTREESFDRLLAALAHARVEALVTAELGSVRVRLRAGGGMRVETFARGRWRQRERPLEARDATEGM